MRPSTIHVACLRVLILVWVGYAYSLDNDDGHHNSQPYHAYKNHQIAFLFIVPYLNVNF